MESIHSNRPSPEKDTEYSNKKSDYNYKEPPIIEAGEETETTENKKFPDTIILVIGFISLTGYLMRGDLTTSILFFIIPTTFLLLFHFSIKEEDEGGIEEDLRKLKQKQQN